MIDIKNVIIRQACKNTNWIDTLYENYKQDVEKQVEQLANKMSQYDTIRDTSSLLELKKRIIQDGEKYCSYNGNKTNFRLYGIGRALFGDRINNVKFLPSMEHGVIFHDCNWGDTSLTARASCVTFGKFRKDILRRYYKTPIFEVGPYIQYADSYYSDEEMEKWKTKLGKTLVVFPMHSTDDSELSYSQKKYIREIKKLAVSFDSVFVCMFWWNLDTPIVNAFKKEGFIVGSAGYREDPMFLCRQKAIIEAADSIVTDAVGTHVGYCYKLGKTVKMIDSGTQTNIYGDNFMRNQVEIIKETLLSDDHKRIDRIMQFYWGSDISYTKQELDKIAEINEEITVNGRFWIKNYVKEARKLLVKYHETDEIKYKLLERALQ